MGSGNENGLEIQVNESSWINKNADHSLDVLTCSIAEYFTSCAVFLTKLYFNSYPAISTCHEYVEVVLCGRSRRLGFITHHPLKRFGRISISITVPLNDHGPVIQKTG